MFFKSSKQEVLSTLLAVMILSTTTLAVAENVNRYINRNW
jgi:hypothetical protein